VSERAPSLPEDPQGIECDARFQTIERWFHALAPLPVAQREATLLAREPDAGVRDEVLRMLRCAGSDASPFDLATPPGWAALRLPRRVGDWKLVRELGSGGMGIVYEAERDDGSYESRVAIKMLPAFPAQASQDHLRFERRILASLDHPHIARLLDGGETEEGQPYLVMELVVGALLPQWMRENSPTLDARLDLFQKLVSAVAHAHQRLVVHRDIKPSNVMIRTDGQPKLLDFGVAKLLEPVDPGPGAGRSTRVFTPGYASPEQQQGRAVTTAADIFSLGILLDELLTGASPASSDGAPLQWQPVRPDAELRGVIACATAKDPAARYSNAGALYEDIERWRAGLPLRAAPDSIAYRARKFLGRHRLGVVALALASITGAVLVWRIQDERDRALLAEQQARAALSRSTAQFRFLNDFFLGVGQRDPDGTLPDGHRLLDRARDAIGRVDDVDTGAVAELELLLGNSYLHAQRWSDAAAMYDQGLARAGDRIAPLRRATELRDWARALLRLDRPIEALDRLGRAAALLPTTGVDLATLEVAVRLRITRIHALRQLADVDATADAPELVAEIESSLAFADRHLPRTHALRGSLLMEKALSMEKAQRLDELVEVRREALAVWSADPSAFAHDVAVQKLNLARALRLAGRSLAEAERLLDDVRDVFGTQFGASGLARIEFEHAALALARGEVAPASDRFERGLELLARAGMAPDSRVALLAGEIALARGDGATARSQFRRAAALATSAYQRLAAVQAEQRITLGPPR
jgi:serine/threonine-protein kinase